MINQSFSGKDNSFYNNENIEESKVRISLLHKGRIPWNKGKKGIYSKEYISQLIERNKGNKYNLGKHHSEETKRKIGKKSKGRKHTEEFKKRMSEFFKLNNPMKNPEIAKKISQIKKGVGRSNEMKRKLSETRKRKFAFGELIISKKVKKKHSERMQLERNPMWKGGKSFEPYTSDFNNKIKKTIQKRDNKTCQLCNKKELNQVLVIHHLNYNKADSSLNNLIALCNSCHSKTNVRRDYWEDFFKNKLNQK